MSLDIFGGNLLKQLQSRLTEPDNETTFVLANQRAGGECLEKTQKGWDNWFAFQSKPCISNSPNQKIEFIREDNGDYSLKSSEDNYFVAMPPRGTAIDAFAPKQAKAEDVRALWAGDRGGDGKHGYFKIYGTGKNQDKSGLDALKNGPVKIGSSYYDSRRFHMEDADGWLGERLRNFTNSDVGDDKAAQTFISHHLLKECNAKGIAFDNCTKAALVDCTQASNQTVELCPAQYCTKPENVHKPECRTYCTVNKGSCDAAANTYCSTEPGKSSEFCNCFGPFPESDYSKEASNKGYVLRRDCNLNTCVGNENAYKTQDMIEKTCPSQNICLQGIDVSKVGGSSTITNVDMSCNFPGNTPNNTHNDTPDDTSDDKSKKQSSSSTISPIIFIIGGIVLFFILIVFLLLR